MAGNKIKGLTIEIGGDTTALNKALAGVNKTTKDLQSELKQVDKLLKVDPKNTELLTQKQKLLTDSVDGTKKKLETLKEAARQAQEQLERGEISEEQFRALQREVVATEQKLEGLEKEAKEFGSVFKQQMEAAGESVKEFGGKVEGAGKKIMPASAVMTGLGIAAFKFAADAEDAMGAADQIFKGSADTVKDWALSLEGYYGIASGKAVEYANMMGSMLQNIGGLTEAEAAKQAQTLIELAGDLTAMYGGTTEDAVRALTGALKGNNTMLDNYGISALDAQVKSKALELGLLNEGDQMDAATKQAATLALIMDQTTDAQGQAAREAEGASGSMRTLVTDLQNMAVTFGQALLPVITPFIQKLSDLVRWFGGLSEGARTALLVIGGIVAALGPTLIIIGKLISAVGSIMKILPAVANPIGLIIAAVAALVGFLIYLWNTNEGFRNAVIAIWDVIKAKFLEAWEFIKAVWDVVAPYFLAIWEGIKLTFSVVTEILGAFFSAAWEFIKAVWDVVGPYFMGLWEGIKLTFSVIVKVLGGFFEGAWKAIKAIWDVVEKYFGNVWAGIKFIFSFVKAVLSGNFGDAWDMIRLIWDGVKAYFAQKWQDIKDVFGAVVGYFQNIFSEAWQKVVGAFSAVKTFFSEKLTEIKAIFSLENFKKIFNDSIVGGLGAVKDAVAKKAGELWQAIKDVLKKPFEFLFGGTGGFGGGTGGFGGKIEFAQGAITNRNGVKGHKGMDFAVPTGTPVRTPVGGRVVTSKDLKSSYGKYIVVADANGLYHYFAHLSKRLIQAGATVPAGALIGYSGSTGNSTGPHVHYEVRRGNSYKDQVNPMQFLKGYATGGFPALGEIFRANERGIELMGKMGQKPVVTNNMQIVEGITAAVQRGMVQAFAAVNVAGGGGGVVIHQTNNFGDTYSKRDGAAAVRDLNRQLGKVY